MSNQSEIVQELLQRTEKYINPNGDQRIYYSGNIIVPTGSRMLKVDYMQYKPLNDTTAGIEKGDFICYELIHTPEYAKARTEYPMLGDMNYCIMPEGLYKEVSDILPKSMGILIPALKTGCPLRPIRKAKRVNRLKPFPEMMLLMLKGNARNRSRITGDLISRREAVKKLQEQQEQYDDKSPDGTDSIRIQTMQRAEDILHDIQSANTVPTYTEVRALKMLKSYFKKVCVNEYRAIDYRKTLTGGTEPTFFLYKRNDLCTWSREAFERGEHQFYAEPVDPNNPKGAMRLAEPRYAYMFTKDLSIEDYNRIFEQ